MFPKYKIEKHSLLFFKWEKKEPDGWEDLGFVSSGDRRAEICDFCMRQVKIGRDDGEVFKFCPRCLTRVKQ